MGRVRVWRQGCVCRFVRSGSWRCRCLLRRRCSLRCVTLRWVGLRWVGLRLAALRWVALRWAALRPVALRRVAWLALPVILSVIPSSHYGQLLRFSMFGDRECEQFAVPVSRTIPSRSARCPYACARHSESRRVHRTGIGLGSCWIVLPSCQSAPVVSDRDPACVASQGCSRYHFCATQPHYRPPSLAAQCPSLVPAFRDSPRSRTPAVSYSDDRLAAWRANTTPVEVRTNAAPAKSH
jgi:hypothetical protein